MERTVVGVMIIPLPAIWPPPWTCWSRKGAEVPEISLVRPGLWMVDTNVEDFQVRGIVIVGDLGSVIWDTLARPQDMDGVGELTRGLPLSVIYSHGDWDHVLGTCGLHRPWNDVIAHQDCAQRFLEELPNTLREKKEGSPGTYDGVQLVAPTRTFQNTLRLDLGGVTLEIHSLQGHTSDSVVGFVPEWGVLLAGDTVETPLPFLNPDSPLDLWAESLERWLLRLEGTRNPPMVIPSHGRIGGPELLRNTAQYLTDLIERREPRIPTDLTRFYRETHAMNRTLAWKE